MRSSHLHEAALNPELTASWEKGPTYVAEGSITPDEYMQKLERFVIGRTYNAVHMGNTYGLRPAFDAVAVFYQNAGKEKKLNFKKGNDHEKEEMKITELYDLTHTLASDYLKQFTYPWRRWQVSVILSSNWEIAWIRQNMRNVVKTSGFTRQRRYLTAPI